VEALADLMSRLREVLLLSAAVVALLLALVGPAEAAPCPNEAVRVGPSASLPDCRAYELVSPPDSNGRVFDAFSTYTLGYAVDLFPTEMASPDGESFVYEVYAGALGSPGGGSGVMDIYRSQHGLGGWSTTERLSRSSDTIDWTLPGGVSSDHAFTFSNEHRVDYLRLPDGSFELTAGNGPVVEPYANGRYITPGGGHVLFSTGNGGFFAQSRWCQAEGSACKVKPLAANAPPEGTGAVYDRPAGGAPHVVSLLPDGGSPGKTPGAGEQACYAGASADASSVAFKITKEAGSCETNDPAAVILYVHIHNGVPAAEESLEVAEGNPAYAGLSDDGRYIFFVTEGGRGTIHRLDTQTEADVAINPGAPGQIVNVSADGTHVYFISEAQIEGHGEAGRPNLYAWSPGAPVKLVTIVAASDMVTTSGSGVGQPSLTNWSFDVTGNAHEFSNGASAGNWEYGPGSDSSRTTPDGNVLVFESKAQLTPYENTTTEIYRYEYDTGKLICASCNPAGPPTEQHESRLQEVALVQAPNVVNNLTQDGSRIFFETSEALVPADVNGSNDIYEWQEDEGTPHLNLISSGSSPIYSPVEGFDNSPSAWRPIVANLLFGVTPDGGDVFFGTNQALVPGAGENGTQAIYDARVNGGQPQPPTPAFCSEEGCRSTPVHAQPSFAVQASETTSGSGNVKPKKRSCGGHRRPHRSRHHHRCSRHSTKKAQASRAAEGGFAVAEPPAGDPVDASSATGPSAASAAVTSASSGGEPPFAIEEWKGSLTAGSGASQRPETNAGMHPDFNTFLEFAHHLAPEGTVTNGAPEEVEIELPPGLLGNPKAVPACSMGSFLMFANCSPDSQVGITRVVTGVPGGISETVPVFSLTPPHPAQEVAKFGFYATVFPVYIDADVRTAGDYGVTATIHDPPGLGSVYRAKTTFWGNPAAGEHDKQRGTMEEIHSHQCPEAKPCQEPNEERASGIPASERRAFFTNPSACEEGSLGLQVSSYQHPGERFTATAPLERITGCTGLPFAPSFAADPTSHEAGASTGLKTKLILPQHLGENERATATMREARVTLPEGMQVAAGAANWIGTCSDDQVGYHKEIDTACPDSSKLGTATFTSPALSMPIEGTIYQRAPEPGRQLGLWLTADALGLHIKLPGSLEPDKQTGRLTAVFGDLPQVPVEEIDLNVWGGPRAPLQNPDHCGTFTTDFTFSPHSDDPAATGQSQMQITEGCNQGFSPTLRAGVTEPVAGKFSPFVFDLTRPDGQQALRGFELHLPDGELAKIKGVPLCSDAEALAATCPQGSRIGRIQATTGPGPDPFTLPDPGKAQPQIYLAGSYKGSPFSIVSEVPAQAGPFDLGTLAVRSGLDVEPESGRAVVKADPLPQYFEGIGIAYRNLHAVVDRPEFNLNPTDCREMAVTADVTSTKGTVAHPAARFQVDGCKALKFGPKLSLKLEGGTRRASYPALTAVLKARKGDANIAFASVALPHSEFLAQEHIGTICTRVQFAADKCPKGSVYGKAKAVTPLLDTPLAGPVYLRSSNHPLPDLVAKLGGQLEIDLVGRIDSKNGGIRTSFDSVPDAPVTKFVLQMKGGKKGLLTNSTDICRGSHRATVQMKAQNGRVAQLRPTLQSSGCSKNKLGKQKKHH
jgi:hypothetical protein